MNETTNLTTTDLVIVEEIKQRFIVYFYKFGEGLVPHVSPLTMFKAKWRYILENQSKVIPEKERKFPERLYRFIIKMVVLGHIPFRYLPLECYIKERLVKVQRRGVSKAELLKLEGIQFKYYSFPEKIISILNQKDLARYWTEATPHPYLGENKEYKDRIKQEYDILLYTLMELAKKTEGIDFDTYIDNLFEKTMRDINWITASEGK